MQKSRWCTAMTAHTANAEQVHALIEQASIPIFKMHELGTQPTWSQFEAALVNTSLPPVNVLSMS